MPKAALSIPATCLVAAFRVLSCKAAPTAILGRSLVNVGNLPHQSGGKQTNLATQTKARFEWSLLLWSYACLQVQLPYIAKFLRYSRAEVIRMLRMWA